MNKKLTIKIDIFVMIVIVSLLFLFNEKTLKTSYAKTTPVYTRSELQEYVVAAAASYYYNNTYTDYEGYWAEESKSNYSSAYDVSPEELSRSKVRDKLN